MTGRRGRHRYRAWDGIQAHAVIPPEDLLQQLGDRFLSEEADQVLNDAIHRGLVSSDGSRLAGIDDLRGQIRQQLRDLEMSDLQLSMEEGTSGLSDDARDLLRDLAASPSQAGRLLAGASPGARDELSQLRIPGGPLQDSGDRHSSSTSPCSTTICAGSARLATSGTCPLTPSRRCWATTWQPSSPR
ncbi:MAG: hypothetical protein R2849_14370 [Thermomicrobiales bacterium]